MTHQARTLLICCLLASPIAAAPLLSARNSLQPLSPSQETERRLCGNQTIAHNVIIETDFTQDIDDMAALAAAHALADQCHWRILAVMYNEKQADCPPAIHAVNQWYGRGDIPVGIWGGPFANSQRSPYCAYVRTVQEDGHENDGHEQYPDWFSTGLNSEFEAAIHARNYGDVQNYTTQFSMDVYKRVLQTADDASVTIVSIGYPQDLAILPGFSAELKSLWSSKINNMYVMGACFNFDCSNSHGVKQQSLDLYKIWHKPIITSCEGGEEWFRTGLNQSMIDDIDNGQYRNFRSVSPVKRAFFHHCGLSFAKQFCHVGDQMSGALQGRRSWDPFTVVLAAKDIGATGDRSGVTTGPNHGRGLNGGCFPPGFTDQGFFLAGISEQQGIFKYTQNLILREPLIAEHV